jgi:hypothetical protein
MKPTTRILWPQGKEQAKLLPHPRVAPKAVGDDVIWHAQPAEMEYLFDIFM